MRLIDADKLEERFMNECEGECAMCKHILFDTKKAGYSCKLIRKAPTVEERKKGGAEE